MGAKGHIIWGGVTVVASGTAFAGGTIFQSWYVKHKMKKLTPMLSNALSSIFTQALEKKLTQEEINELAVNELKFIEQIFG